MKQKRLTVRQRGIRCARSFGFFDGSPKSAFVIGYHKGWRAALALAAKKRRK